MKRVVHNDDEESKHEIRSNDGRDAAYLDHPDYAATARPTGATGVTAKSNNASPRNLNKLYQQV